MGLETVTYISDFNQANPDGATDLKSEGDNHLRNIKKGVLNTFPNIDGEVSTTQAELNILDGATLSTAELNYVDGVTSSIQTQLDGKMVGSNNLSEITTPATARTNLGLGALAVLDTVSGTEIDADSISNSEMADDAITHTEIDFSFNSGGSQTINLGTPWTVPEGLYAFSVTGSGTGTIQVNQGGSWRISNTDWAGGAVVSNGSSVRIGASGASIVVYYLRIA